LHGNEKNIESWAYSTKVKLFVGAGHARDFI
jgi:hypothetical protein